jgi:hypothetical protein
MESRKITRSFESMTGCRSEANLSAFKSIELSWLPIVDAFRFCDMPPPAVMAVFLQIQQLAAA